MLRSISNIHPLYMLPGDPVTEEVLIPCFQSATYVDCMVGFFSSEILVSLAPGLASFINQSNQTKLRLIISPLLRNEDREAIEQGIIPSEEIASNALEGFIVTEDSIAKHTLKCLSWLLRHGRVEIKIALMKGALFHPKVWLFREGDDVIAAHGSSNMTYAGVQKNIEQISISKSWGDSNQHYITEKFSDHFKQLWTNQDKSCSVVSMPQAINTSTLFHARRRRGCLQPPQWFASVLSRRCRRQTARCRTHRHRLQPCCERSNRPQWALLHWVSYRRNENV